MKQWSKEDVGAFAAGAVFVLVAVLVLAAGGKLVARWAAEGAGSIRAGVYPDPVCEVCGKPLDGRSGVCTPEGE